MDAKFTHLSGDIRQPVLIVGDDPDVEGNVLYAPLLPVQSIGAANLFDSAVASPTDTVDPAVAGTAAEAEATTEPVDTTTGDGTGAAADDAAYVDNGDGTYTRTGDGVRGHFTPDGFVASGGEEVSGVSWGS
jgi:hypothetical protein